MNGFVYHIENPLKPGIENGYVGVVRESKGIARRFRLHATTKTHMRSKIAEHNVSFENHVRELFYGDLQKCYDLERKLRPEQNIGWNLAVGGGGPYFGFGEELSKHRSRLQSERMQNEELRKKQSHSFKETYYNDPASQELRRTRAKEHMADPLKRAACLNAVHKKIKCHICGYENNPGNVKQHIKRKHSE